MPQVDLLDVAVALRLAAAEVATEPLHCAITLRHHIAPSACAHNAPSHCAHIAPSHCAHIGTLIPHLSPQRRRRWPVTCASHCRHAAVKLHTSYCHFSGVVRLSAARRTASLRSLRSRLRSSTSSGGSSRFFKWLLYDQAPPPCAACSSS